MDDKEIVKELANKPFTHLLRSAPRPILDLVSAAIQKYSSLSTSIFNKKKKLQGLLDSAASKEIPKSLKLRHTLNVSDMTLEAHNDVVRQKMDIWKSNIQDYQLKQTLLLADIAKLEVETLSSSLAHIIPVLIEDILKLIDSVYPSLNPGEVSFEVFSKFIQQQTEVEVTISTDNTAPIVSLSRKRKKNDATSSLVAQLTDTPNMPDIFSHDLKVLSRWLIHLPSFIETQVNRLQQEKLFAIAEKEISKARRRQAIQDANTLEMEIDTPQKVKELVNEVLNKKWTALSRQLHQKTTDALRSYSKNESPRRGKKPAAPQTRNTSNTAATPTNMTSSSTSTKNHPANNVGKKQKAPEEEKTPPQKETK